MIHKNIKILAKELAEKPDNKEKDALKRFKQPAFYKAESYVVLKDDGNTYLIEEDQ